MCTLPLVLGRVCLLARADVPYWYFCLAGALITSNGWLDVLLWGTTRHTVVFGPLDEHSSAGAAALGLQSFAFMRTPPGREFGNMVWVQGAIADAGGDGDDDDPAAAAAAAPDRGRARLGGAARRGRSWWGALVRRVVGGGGGGVGPGEGGGGGGSPDILTRRLGRGARLARGLELPDLQTTCRSGHVKSAGQCDMCPFGSAEWRRELGPVEGGIAITKYTAVTVDVVDKSDLESGARTPRTLSQFSTPTSAVHKPQGKDHCF